MKSKLMKVLSLAMALTLVASLAACGGNGDDETTAPADTTAAEDVVTPDETTPDGETVADPSAVEDTTVIVTGDNGETVVVTRAPTNEKTTAKTPAGGNNDKPADTGMAAPKNAAEAMKMFNDALGKTSVSGKMTKVNLDKAQATAIGQDIDLKTVDPNVDPTFKSETTKKFNNKLYPVNGASLAGTPSKNGNVITFKFNLAPVNSATATYGQNGFAYFVTANDAKATVGTIINKIGGPATALKIKIKSIDSINLTGSMEVKIDANTGKLISATYSFKEVVKGKASAIIAPGGLNVDIIGSGTCTYTGK